MIENDLNDQLTELGGRAARVGSIVPFLGSGTWANLRGSGDLALLDAKVLRQAGRAYDRIAVTAYLEETAFRLGQDPFIGDPAKVWVQTHISPAQVEQDVHTNAAIKVALDTIRACRATHPQIRASEDTASPA